MKRSREESPSQEAENKRVKHEESSSPEQHMRLDNARWTKLENTRTNAETKIWLYRQAQKEIAQRLLLLENQLQVTTQEEADYCRPYVKEVRRDLEVIYKKLGSIPEIREMIWKAIYVQKETIQIIEGYPDEYSDAGDIEDTNEHLAGDLPQDPSRYLSAAVVGKDVSYETAKAFYGHNTFAVSPWYLAAFGEHDHYKSFVIPYKLVRKLTVRWYYCDPWGYYAGRPDTAKATPDNVTYVTMTKDPEKYTPGLPGWLDVRDRTHSQLGVLSRFEALRELHITINIGRHNQWDARTIADLVMTLKSKGVRVKVLLASSNRPDCSSRDPNVIIGINEELRDVSDFFDAPTTEDLKLFAAKVPRSACQQQTRTMDDSAYIDSQFDEYGGPPTFAAPSLPSLHVPLPCLGGSCNLSCSRNLSWHAGWYRGLLHQYREVLLHNTSQSEVGNSVDPSIRKDSYFRVNLSSRTREPEIQYYEEVQTC